MSDVLIAQDFEALAGRQIALRADGATFNVEIAEVRPLANPSPRPAAPFVAVFRERGARRSHAQGLYAVDLGARGVVEVFLVPIGPDGTGMCYEAVFN